MGKIKKKSEHIVTFKFKMNMHTNSVLAVCVCVYKVQKRTCPEI